MMESWRVRALLEDRGAARTAYAYEQEKAMWLQRAAAYEHQLQELAAAHTTTERDLRTTIEDRLREISSLKQDLLDKNSTIEGIGLRCDDLHTALAAVQDQLKRERVQEQAEREQEMAKLEARLMSSLKVEHQLSSQVLRMAEIVLR